MDPQGNQTSPLIRRRLLMTQGYENNPLEFGGSSTDKYDAIG